MISEFERCIRIGRKEKKLSQDELAKIIGIDIGDISRLERGLFVPLSDAQLSRLAKFADVDKTMFFSIYRSTFYKDLRKLKNAENTPPSPAPPQEQMDPELLDIGKSIMAMPPDTKRSLLQTIRMLVQAQAYSMKIAG